MSNISAGIFEEDDFGVEHWITLTVTEQGLLLRQQEPDKEPDEQGEVPEQWMARLGNMNDKDQEEFIVNYEQENMSGQSLGEFLEERGDK